MSQPAAPVPRRAIAIEVTVNDKSVRRKVQARTTLADFLRHELGLTGTHVGCEHGVCGACTVLVDGNAMRSCILYAVQADGRRVDSVENLADGDVLHPLQTAFGEHGALARISSSAHSPWSSMRFWWHEGQRRALQEEKRTCDLLEIRLAPAVWEA